MLVIQKYITKEIFKLTLIVLFALVVVFSVFHFLEELDNNYPVTEKFRYILYSLPVFSNLISMLAVFIGSTIFIGQLNYRREMQVIFTSGVSYAVFIKKISIVIFFVSVLLSSFGEIYSPYFYEKSNQIKSVALGKQFNNKVSNIWLAKDKTFVNIDSSIEGNKFNGINIYEFNSENILSNFVTSEEGYLENQSLKIPLANSVSIISDSGIFSQKHSVEKFNMILNTDQLQNLRNDLSSMNLMELIDSAKFSNSYGLRSDKYIHEILSRITKPLIALGLFLIALPFVVNFNRNVSIGNMVFTSIAIALLFNLLVRLFGVYASNYGLNVYLTILLPIILLYLVGFLNLNKLVKT